MVATENDNGILSQASVLECFEKASNTVVTDLEKSLAVSIKIFLVHLDFGEVNVHILIHVPVLLRNGVRVVRILSAPEHDLLIVVQLVASSARTGLKDRAGIVVPLKTGVRLIPVHSPAKVTRINVTGKSLLVAVKLVADEVHLASKRGMVALGPKVMSVGWHIGSNLGSIVISANLHGKLATDQTHA
ncbi:hypothetical protein HG531_012721 [Fusarium graminearum]|nr:hypothetical protein HG531_012721 [Fusarium graminearum]